MTEYKLTANPSSGPDHMPSGAEEATNADVTRYFAFVDVKSDYLKNLLGKTLRQILNSGIYTEARFGAVVEGPTIAGGIAEVCGDQCIRIDSRQLRQYEEPVAMALVAHELAHHQLKHFRMWKNYFAQEQSADNLAKQWGFNMDRFRQTFGPPRLNSGLLKIAVIHQNPYRHG